MKYRHCLWLLAVCFTAQTPAFAQTMTISSRVYEVAETAGSFDLAITRSSAATAGAVRVGVFPYGNTGAAVVGGTGADVLPGAAVIDGLAYVDVAFAAGQSTATASIPVVNDTAGEGNEQFGVVLRRSNGYGQVGIMSYALVTIQDDELGSTAAPMSPPGPAPIVEGTIYCIFGTPFDDDIYWDRIITQEYSSLPLFLPTAADMASPELIVLGGEGDDRFTCYIGEETPLPVTFDGEQGFGNEIVLVLDSVRDTNTATYCLNELDVVSQRAAGTVGGVSYPASTWTAAAVNVQIMDVSTQIGGGFGDGDDIAFMKDTAGNDCLETSPTLATLTGTNYEAIARGFDRTVAYGSTGYDKANLKGSAADEEFESKPAFSRLMGDRPNPFNNGLDNTSYDNYVAGFDCVTADGCGGQDIAYISGSNEAENYVGTPTSGRLFRGLRKQEAIDFDDVVVFAGGGGDVAKVYDSAGDDVFVGRLGNSAMVDLARTYSHTLKGFQKVEGCSDAGGNDEAQLYDTHGSDTLTATPTIALLGTPKNFSACAEGFSKVIAISTEGGFDRLNQSVGLTYALQTIGPWVR